MNFLQTSTTSNLASDFKKNDALEGFVDGCILRFFNKDWGTISDGDKRLNDLSMKDFQGRVLGSYELPEGLKDDSKDRVWIVANPVEYGKPDACVVAMWPEDF